MHYSAMKQAKRLIVWPSAMWTSKVRIMISNELSHEFDIGTDVHIFVMSTQASWHMTN